MIITIGNIKGGVGKSTIACNLAVQAAKDKRHTLLIDSDTQSSSVAFSALREQQNIKTISICTPTLHNDMKGFAEKFEVIIIDVGGRDSAAFRSAMMACELLIIPVLPSQFDVLASGDTIKILNEARTFKEIDAYFVLNQVVANTKVSVEAMKALKEFGKDVGLLKTFLYSRTVYKNSISNGLGVTEQESSGKGAKEVESLYKEITGLNK